MVRFLPSYVGSKRQWVSHPALQSLSERNFVELFSGSAVLSANLARNAVLNDLDPVVCRIMARFDEQIVPEVFTRQMYYEVRQQEDWWRWAYCLQSISYSGVFRYSKNGFNVPIKGGPNPDRNKVNEWYLRASYKKALQRWRELAPVVVEGDYKHAPLDLFSNPVVVFDPPYEGSQAAYNTVFDYDVYWRGAHAIIARGYTTVLFDRVSNLEKQRLPITAVRKMRVNGARPGDEEGVCIVG